MIAYQLISDITVTSATTSVSFTGLDIGKDDELLLVVDYTSLNNAYINLFVNDNVTPSNYYSQNLSSGGTGVASTRYNFPYLCDNRLASVSTAGIANIKLTNNGYFVFQSNTSRAYGNSTNTIDKNYGSSTFASTSITSLKISSSVASSIGIGSRFQLYKLTAQKIADIIVSSPTTSVDITGLAIDKGSEYMLVSDFIQATVGNMLVFVNGNTTVSNYYVQNIRANSTSIDSARFNGSYMTVNDYTKFLMFTSIKLTNNGYFVYQNQSASNYGTSTIALNSLYGTSTFTSSSITSITINVDSVNDIAVGSRFQLYKLK